MLSFSMKTFSYFDSSFESSFSQIMWNKINSSFLNEKIFFGNLTAFIARGIQLLKSRSIALIYCWIFWSFVPLYKVIFTLAAVIFTLFHSKTQEIRGKNFKTFKIRNFFPSYWVLMISLQTKYKFFEKITLI
jgi:hypothetical protein